MEIRMMHFDGMNIIDLVDFGKHVQDEINLGHAIDFDCREEVNISGRDAQILLSSPKLISVNDGFSDDLLDGKVVTHNGKQSVKWENINNCLDYHQPKKLFIQIIKAGKKATADYLNSPYNHYKKHYKKVPEITTDDNDNFVDAHKLV